MQRQKKRKQTGTAQTQLSPPENRFTILAKERERERERNKGNTGSGTHAGPLSADRHSTIQYSMRSIFDHRLCGSSILAH